jgi:hypothetical protein
VGGTFELLGGGWVQNSAALPSFSAGDFKLSDGTFLRVAGGDGGLSTPISWPISTACRARPRWPLPLPSC